jgi:hypothetical protein
LIFNDDEARLSMTENKFHIMVEAIDENPDRDGASRLRR